MADPLTTTASLALDAGQTGIRVRITSTGFARDYPGAQTNRDLLPQLAEAVCAAASEFGGPLGTVAIGTTGLTEADNDPGRLRALCADAGVRRLILAHDSITSYLGALGRRHGVVVAAGTGVVTLGVGPAGLARVDGWGNIMGDAGSGYWIGREAMDAVMRAYDGRGVATALSAVVLARFPRLDQAYIEVQTDPDRVRLVASFARAVSDLAGVDAVAAGICFRASEELALSAVTAALRSGLGAEPLICRVGNVFGSPAVSDAFSAALLRRCPGAHLVDAAGDGLAGAEALLTLPPDHVLAGHIAVSRG
jgi:glucosamine kinase